MMNSTKKSTDTNSPCNFFSSKGPDKGQNLVFSPGNHEEAPCQICGIQKQYDVLKDFIHNDHNMIHMFGTHEKKSPYSLRIAQVQDPVTLETNSSLIIMERNQVNVNCSKRYSYQIHERELIHDKVTLVMKRLYLDRKFNLEYCEGKYYLDSEINSDFERLYQAIVR